MTLSWRDTGFPTAPECGTDGEVEAAVPMDAAVAAGLIEEAPGEEGDGISPGWFLVGLIALALWGGRKKR